MGMDRRASFGYRCDWLVPTLCHLRLQHLQSEEITRKEIVKAFQDYYPENVAHCYGRGVNNSHGHQIKTYWDGDETVTRFAPES